jgi:Protein of unknown function (DUF3224)
MWLSRSYKIGGSLPAMISRSETHVNKETVVKTLATGTFEVKVLPLPADDGVDTGGFGRLSLDKKFSGDLTGTGRGQMVAAGTAVEGSAAYVALDRISGTLNGRTGAFILQHNGTMRRGAAEMHITVVPDSGTDELTGLAGTFRIIVEAGQHFYELEYTIGG